MIEKCPGRDSRNISAESLSCPYCSYQAEIFSDEAKRACPRCQKIFYRQRLPSCVDWCKSAPECLGISRVSLK